MASIRDNILGALVARLDAITGWNGQLRSATNVMEPASTEKVLAIVAFLNEDKELSNSQQYAATMQVLVYIVANIEDADPTLDGSNPYRYLDRLVALAESTVHAPDSWGIEPGFTDVQIRGHDVSDPTEANQVTAELRLVFTYRHDYQDPGAL